MFETILLAGIVLGVAQLSAGIAIGLWIGRRRAAAAGNNNLARGSSEDRERAHRLATDLETLAAQVAHSVDDHSERVTRISERLNEESTSEDQLTGLVVGVVSELVSANGRLVADLQQSRKELAERLEELADNRQQALTDALTGLPNRRAFDGHLSDRIEAWRKRQTPLSLMMIDVDRFKQFNDTHGHQAGDEALRVVAAGLREALRSNDVVARYGGEEFGVLLPQTELDAAGPAVKKVLRSVAGRDIETPSGTVRATVSIGVATIAPQERSEALIERADSALYAAKEHGRNRAWAHTGSGLELLAIGEVSEDPVDDGSFAESGRSESQTSTDASIATPTSIEQACSSLSASLADFMSDDSATTSSSAVSHVDHG